jgi:hypothetical protein
VGRWGLRLWLGLVGCVVSGVFQVLFAGSATTLAILFESIHKESKYACFELSGVAAAV